MYQRRQPPMQQKVRLNTMPPAGAAFYDTGMMTCSPCQSGSMNYCQFHDTGDDNLDWILQSARQPAAAVAAGVSDCCSTVTDPSSGQYKTTCDTTQGCGWIAGPFLSDQVSCKFTTQGATYSTYEACQEANITTEPSMSGETWFPPCTGDAVTDCYYPSLDACMPAVFGQQRRQAAAAAAMRATTSCTNYVCDATKGIRSGGRVHFPATACKCSK